MRGNRNPAHRGNGAGIQALFKAKEANAGLAISLNNGVSDGGCSSPSGQEREMHIPPPLWERLEGSLIEQSPIGDHNGHIGRAGLQRCRGLIR